ncbi:HNH endonuclease [Helcobacillus massiliensis]|uniref:HNH endonuclease signature motif containing protein n=1 Tax=Helcobacillus massiliensis TaxID=521392 RepID=UPI0021A46AEF|nr:HNH endonuclease signature motif containing protein [Helcobacillus massiliensis]MCT1557747.1 HNH endonuclease [Helcobacillus massiliensis]MCT2036019.1 HNH endonuclease [Helcobacillus massiliensis]MCT2331711.1 HNH endonuclease [Helcobacillus massiliensis]
MSAEQIADEPEKPKRPHRQPRGPRRTTPMEQRLARERVLSPAAASASTTPLTETDFAALSAVRERTVARAREAAADYRLLARLYVEQDSGDEARLAAELAEIRVGIALNCSIIRAGRALEGAHRAATCLPGALARLERGELTAAQFDYLLFSTRAVSEKTLALADPLIAEWEFDGEPEKVDKAIRELAAYLRELDEDTPPAPVQDVRLLPPSPDKPGTMTVQVDGSVPEMVSMIKRLDRAAEDVQRAQAAALESGDRIPLDIDGEVAESGIPMPRAMIRSLLMSRAEFSLDGAEATTPRFQLFVQVPALSLLGQSHVGGMIDGIHPIPVAMARDLAGRSATWMRILTDPASGAILPLKADRYKPSTEMLRHLRMRHVLCAAPGCTRRTAQRSEADHIEEFDHHSPADGGRTDLENLHLLCRRHHQVKTAKLIDPKRTRPPRPGRSPGATEWTIGTDRTAVTATDDVDLLSAHDARVWLAAWRRSHPDDADNPGCSPSAVDP